MHQQDHDAVYIQRATHPPDQSATAVREALKSQVNQEILKPEEKYTFSDLTVTSPKQHQ